MIRTMLALALVLLTAADCGPRPLEVVFLSNATWVQRADAEARVRALANRAAQFWGGAGVDDLRGWFVVVEDGAILCGTGHQVGCTEFLPLVPRITVSAWASEGWAPKCAEETFLAHEVGHAILRTAGHDDPRWVLLPQWQAADIASRPDCL